MITLEEAYFDFTGVEASATQLTPYQRVVVLAKALNAYVEGLDDHTIAEDEELASVLRRLIIEVARDVLSGKHPSVEKLSVKQLARSLDRMDERVEEMPEGPRWWHRIQQTLRTWWQKAKGKVEEGRGLLNQLATTTAGTSQREQALDALWDHLHAVGEDLRPSIPHAWGDLVGPRGHVEPRRHHLRLPGRLPGGRGPRHHHWNRVDGSQRGPSPTGQSDVGQDQARAGKLAPAIGPGLGARSTRARGVPTVPSVLSVWTRTKKPAASVPGRKVIGAGWRTGSGARVKRASGS